MATFSGHEPFLTVKSTLDSDNWFDCNSSDIHCKVVREAFRSSSWFDYAPRDVNKPTTRDANDCMNAKSHARKKPLLAGYYGQINVIINMFVSAPTSVPPVM